MNDSIKTNSYKQEGRSMKKNSMVYVASPLRGDIEGNLEKAKDYCRFISFLGYIPICPHLFFTTFLNDEIEEERNRGICFGLNLLKKCEEIWVFGEQISEGMKEEIKLAEILDLPIQYFPEINREFVEGIYELISR